MIDSQIHRDLGRIDATLDAQADQIASLAKTQTEIGDRIQKIHDILTEVGGGWKTLLIIGGLSSALTAIGLKMLSLAGFDP